MKKEKQALTREQIHGFSKKLLEDMVYALLMQVDDMNEKMDTLIEMIAVLKNEKYGRSTEELNELEKKLGNCFNESEMTVDQADPQELTEPDIAEINPPSLIAGIATGKFVNALTYYRLKSMFADSGAFIQRPTMARCMINAAEEYFSLMYYKFKEELLSCDVIHADETTVEVNKDGRKAGSKSYMWVYTKEGNDKPVVLYEYQKTRKAQHPKEFLQDYKGWLCCDGYEGYHSLSEDITVCGC